MPSWWKLIGHVQYVSVTVASVTRLFQACAGNPPENPKAAEVEFSKKEVLREEVEIYRQPNHGCLETC
jgi:hypothetical protein